MPRLLMTATASRIAVYTYGIPRNWLEGYLPEGVELDLWEGEPLVSVVNVTFDDVRPRGLPGRWWFHESNVRTYVRHGDGRGIVFLRLNVGRRLFAWPARFTLGPAVRYAPIDRRVEDTDEDVTILDRVGKGDHAQSFRLEAEPTPAATSPARPADDLGAFLKERYTAYGVGRSGGCTAYRVVHEPWLAHSVTGHEVALDWGRLIAPGWARLNGEPPRSVMLLAGSEIAVYAPEPVADEGGS
jgi:uncharacterized protein